MSKKTKTTETKVLDENLEEYVTETELPKSQNGVVCLEDKTKKLRVRKSSDLKSEVLWTIADGTEVEIDLKHSDESFYKVILTNDVEGYCVKEYITLK